MLNIKINNIYKIIMNNNNHISNIIDRLINEKYLYTSFLKNEENKPSIKLMMIQPEWFIELDDEIKYQVNCDIKKVYSKILIEKAENNLSTIDNSDETHRKKRAKLE